MAVGSVKTAPTRPAGFHMPTHDQLVNTYRNITEGREKAHSLKKLAKAPAGFSRAPTYNIARPGALGVNRTVFVIKGEMYLRTQVVAPNARQNWFKVGPAPLF